MYDCGVVCVLLLFFFISLLLLLLLLWASARTRKVEKKRRRKTLHTECEQATPRCMHTMYFSIRLKFIHSYILLIDSFSHSFIHAFFSLLSIHLLVVHSQWMHISWSVASNLYMLQRVQLSDIISYTHIVFVFNVLVFSRYCSLQCLWCCVVLRRLLLKCCLLLRALLIVYAMHVIFVMNK